MLRVNPAGVGSVFYYFKEDIPEPLIGYLHLVIQRRIAYLSDRRSCKTVSCRLQVSRTIFISILPNELPYRVVKIISSEK
ncbi:MAG: hypothetical protein JWQ14_1117 [Adhaeribacter sp.]|nr:hypothetical protein [Adhaeribacter sp.]